MKNKKNDFSYNLTESAVQDIVKQIIQEIDYVQLSGQRAIDVEKLDDNYNLELKLITYRNKPLPEIAEYVQKSVFDGFKSATGMKFTNINIHFEKLIGD